MRGNILGSMSSVCPFLPSPIDLLEVRHGHFHLLNIICVALHRIKVNNSLFELFQHNILVETGGGNLV